MLYILKTISIRNKTEDDLHKDWQIYKLQYRHDTSYNQYIKFLKSWKCDKYSYSEENNCYFTDLSIAKQFAEQNVSDINDGDIYNYIAIIEVPFNCTYADTEISDLYIFKYNNNSDNYNEVDSNFNDETKYINWKNYISI
jgi:hypothetical protein